MNSCQHIWAVVLAGGDGRRLAALTADKSGNTVPKQFCSLLGGRSFLDEALRRAHRVVLHDRTCAIVAAGHQRYWCNSLRTLPSSNVFIQPKNRGTAAGVLVSVLSVLELDPLARILFLPADHYVRFEWALAGTLREAMALSMRSPDTLILVGMDPDGPDPDLGYIVPGPELRDGSQQIEAFVEKPDISRARDLVTAGALWNSFIFAASAESVLTLMRSCLGSMVGKLEEIFAEVPGSRSRWRALAELYDEMPCTDFSRAILQEAVDRLRVVRAPACGWNDLGTPRRLADITALCRMQLSVPQLQL